MDDFIQKLKEVTSMYEEGLITQEELVNKAFYELQIFLATKFQQ